MAQIGQLEIRRLGIIMRGDPDGRLYLFPRVVAAQNYSRIGIARRDRRRAPYHRPDLTGGDGVYA